MQETARDQNGFLAHGQAHLQLTQQIEEFLDAQPLAGMHEGEHVSGGMRQSALSQALQCALALIGALPQGGSGTKLFRAHQTRANVAGVVTDAGAG